MDRNTAAPLFRGWDKPMILAALQGCMGRVRTAEDGRSAAVEIGDFAFFAGEPDRALARESAASILVPWDRDWEELLEQVWGEKIVPWTRYAMEPPPVFDRDRLARYAAALPAGFRLAPMDGELYRQAMAWDWSRDLCGNFTGELDFVRDGLGFLALYQGVPAAGAASYAVCSTGIEIEVDTRPGMRRRGLASACAARLILECLGRGLYPGWGAHNLRSAPLAQKLGYQPEGTYTPYWLSASSGGPGDAMEQ